MKKQWEIAIRTTIVTILLTGVIYPYVVTAIAQMLFPAQANGGLVTNKDGKVIGAEPIAQPFMNPAYLQPRPSAAGDKGWDGTSSGGSNFGVTSKKLQERIAADVKRLKEENPDAKSDVPFELVTASGSGLDPHLSPAAALWQAPRIAKARKTSPDKVEAIINAAVEGRTLGFIGEPRVNVLLVNLELDKQLGGSPTPVPGQDRKEEKKDEKKDGAEAGAGGEPQKP
jgi:potassium-transporting ATPase KdpC subunit